ncbi:MAG: N-6 DNA methylase [Chlorobi bacterium]|nr:N-6 DNA methylase [Chlorobiota bacterium]
MLKTYIKHIFDLWHRDAREESLYPALKELLENMAEILGHREIDITVLPKKTDAGNPDFRVWDGHAKVIGYLEAKSPNVQSLDYIANSEQLERYKNTFPNLILTDFLNFYLFRNGVLIKTVLIARKELFLNKVLPPIENEETFKDLLEDFLSFSTPAYTSARQLAKALAHKTKFLRDEILETELENNSYLKGLKEVIEKDLVHGLTNKQFVDMYAQTITYGLFAARMRAQNPEQFTRITAIQYIPKSIGVLYELFKFISVMSELPANLQVIIDDIVDVLRNTDINAILSQYKKSRGDDDPIIHFYETFLEEFDPELREHRGIYYTPLPVVKYIVSAVDYLLKNKFQKGDGLANQSVKILDPAAGTITFLAQAIHKALRNVKETYGSGFIRKTIKDHILNNFYGFELMMAPYTIGHIKAGFTLEEYNYTLSENERFPLYLTNTLEMHPPEKNLLLPLLSKEGEEALKIKRETPILVIMGNPPYSGHSANQNEWINQLIKEDINNLQSYFKCDGKPLEEKNPKWLQDDYVKFLRFAQWKISKHGMGIVAMITNHSYLDNPTFRGMRQSLMKTFDEIYILDLHGNSLKKEKTPDGRPDENVFDIRQGVAIGIFVKLGRNKKTSYAKVYHADLYGTREEKYQWLSKRKFSPRQFKRINPESPFYFFFIPRDTTLGKQYRKWKSINEIFPLHSVGIVTGRDEVTIKENPEQMWNAVLTYNRAEHNVLKQLTGIKKDERLEQFRKDIANPDKKKIVPVLYRPFDVRYTYYTGTSNGFHERPRKEVMRHMLQVDNLALITHKREEVKVPWSHALITDKISEHGCLSPKTTSYHFPLYKSLQNDLFNNGFTKNNGTNGHKPNIDEKVWQKLKKTYGSVSPEDILYYIYAVLYSNVYRRRYSEFLKYDFPRVPYPRDVKLFRELSNLGRELAELHLLKSPKLRRPMAKYEGSGSDKIDKISYDEENQRIYINESQYFEPVPAEVWNYHIGGYQVLKKWLKDRKSETIDPLHYLKIITAIKETIAIQKQIDKLYPKTEKNPLVF